MQWKPFFHGFNQKFNGKSGDGRSLPSNLLDLEGGECARHWAKSLNPMSDCHFGEDVHAADLGGYPEVRTLFLDPHNRRLAADPAFLA